MRRAIQLAWFLAGAAALWGQIPQPTSFPPVTTSQLNLPISSTLSPVVAANAQLVGNPGPQTIYYWAVTNFTLGQGSPELVAVVPNAPINLSGSNYITIVPLYPLTYVSVDLLKTSGPSPPQGACNCAVATGVTTGGINDQSNSTSSYTIAPVNPNSYVISLDNEVLGAGEAHPILRQNGVFVVDLFAISGTGTVTNFLCPSGLSPLFTCSVALSTTTPTLTFAADNAPANSIFGNLTGSSAPASFVTTQGTDSKVLTAGTVSTTPGTPLCTDANNGATTTGCGSGSGTVTGSGSSPFVPVWTSASNLANSKIQATTSAVDIGQSGSPITSASSPQFGVYLQSSGNGLQTNSLENLIVNSTCSSQGAPIYTFPSNLPQLSCTGHELLMQPSAGISASPNAQSVGLSVFNAGFSATQSGLVMGAGIVDAPAGPFTEARGLDVEVATGSGSSTTARGVVAYTINQQASIATQQGVYVKNDITNSAGVTTNNYGVYVDSPGGGSGSSPYGTITHGYGLYINDQAPSGAVSNADPHGIYVAGPTSANFFAGPTTFNAAAIFASLSSSGTQCAELTASGQLAGTGTTCSSGGVNPGNEFAFAYYPTPGTSALVGPTTNLKTDTNGDFLPTTNGLQNLGASGLAFNILYINQLSVTGAFSLVSPYGSSNPIAAPGTGLSTWGIDNDGNWQIANASNTGALIPTLGTLSQYTLPMLSQAEASATPPQLANSIFSQNSGATQGTVSGALNVTGALTAGSYAIPWGNGFANQTANSSTIIASFSTTIQTGTAGSVNFQPVGGSVATQPALSITPYNNSTQSSGVDALYVGMDNSDGTPQASGGIEVNGKNQTTGKPLFTADGTSCTWTISSTGELTFSAAGNPTCDVVQIAPAGAYLVGTNGGGVGIASLAFAPTPKSSSFTVTAAGFAQYPTYTVASGSLTATLPASTALPAIAGQFVTFVNYGSGTITIAIGSGTTINGGASSLSVGAGTPTSPTGAQVWFDGANYEANLIGTGTGSGTVNTGTTNAFAFYSGATNAVGPTTNATINGGTEVLGTNGSVAGLLTLDNPNSGGAGFSIGNQNYTTAFTQDATDRGYDVRGLTPAAQLNGTGVSGVGHDDSAAIAGCLAAFHQCWIPAIGNGTTTHVRWASAQVISGATDKAMRLTCGGSNNDDFTSGSTGMVSIDIDMGGQTGGPALWIGSPSGAFFNGLTIDPSCGVRDISTSHNSPGWLGQLNVSNSRVDGSTGGSQFRLAALGAPTNPSAASAMVCTLTGGSIASSSFPVTVTNEQLGPGWGASTAPTAISVSAAQSGCTSGSTCACQPGPPTLASNSAAAVVFWNNFQIGMPYSCPAGVCPTSGGAMTTLFNYGQATSAASAVTSLPTSGITPNTFDESAGYTNFALGSAGWNGTGNGGSNNNTAFSNQPSFNRLNCENDSLCLNFGSKMADARVTDFHINLSSAGTIAIQTQSSALIWDGHIEGGGVSAGPSVNIAGSGTIFGGVNVESGNAITGVNLASATKNMFFFECGGALSVCFTDDANSGHNIVVVNDVSGSVSTQQSDILIRSSNSSITAELFTVNGSTSGSASIAAAASAGSPSTWLMPTTDPTVNQVLAAGTPSGGKVQLSWANNGSGGSPALSAITAASASNTIANGNNPQTWDWALTTNSINGLTLGETSASTGTGENILEVITLANTTASNLLLAQGAQSNATSPSILALSSTLNNASLAPSLFTITLTNTASAGGLTGSLFAKFLGGASGTTEEFAVSQEGDVAANGTLTGTGLSSLFTICGGNSSGCTGSLNGASGGAFIQGMDNTNAGSSVVTGGVYIRAGLFDSTGPNAAAIPGPVQLVEGGIKNASGITAVGDVVCITTTSVSYKDCPTSSTVVSGIARQNGSGGISFVFDGFASVNLDNTATIGDNICMSTSAAGQGHDNGTTACSTAFIGVVVAVAGSPRESGAFGAATSTTTLSTSLPYVELRFNSPGSVTIAGTVVPLGSSTSSFPSPGAIGGTTPAAGSFTTLTGTTINTTTHCAAAGTAANPSVASCSAAAAGFFSCATNASAGTCTINTSAITANSVVQIQPDASLGTALSVTCNTTADSALTAPRVASRVSGTSFTINLGTFATNPECFSYVIVD